MSPVSGHRWLVGRHMLGFFGSGTRPLRRWAWGSASRPQRPQYSAPALRGGACRGTHALKEAGHERQAASCCALFCPAHAAARRWPQRRRPFSRARRASSTLPHPGHLVEGAPGLPHRSSGAQVPAVEGALRLWPSRWFARVARAPRLPFKSQQAERRPRAVRLLWQRAPSALSPLRAPAGQDSSPCIDDLLLERMAYRGSCLQGAQAS